MLKFKKLTKDAIIPRREYSNDAGLDLFCNETCIIDPKERTLIPTGIACSFPDSHVLKIENKSGRSLTYGLIVGGGIIDSGYRGEIKVVIFNLSSNKVILGRGEKIAQLILYPICLDEPVEVEELDDATERGTDGFGSTGINKNEDEVLQEFNTELLKIMDDMIEQFESEDDEPDDKLYKGC